MSRPPLGLAVEVETATGEAFRWDGDTTRPENRPGGLSFRTQIGDGYADGSVSLDREITREWPDLNLYDTVRFIGHDGSVAYEGRHHSNPRSVDRSHTVALSLQGWMTHMRDRLFSEIIVDRDLGAWTGPSRTRQLALETANTPHRSDATVAPGATDGLPALGMQLEAPLRTPVLRCEAWYDGGAALIGQLYVEAAASTTNANFNLTPVSSTADDAATQTGADMFSGAAVASIFTPSAARRHLALIWNNPVDTGTAPSQFSIYVRPAVYGDHGLTRYGTGHGGYYVSDILRHLIGRYAPKLSTAGIQNTTYPVVQAAWRSPTEPYAALEQLNEYHLWLPMVWENRTFHYYPPDRTDYDWQVRIGEDGVTSELQGDSTEDLANGVVVTYTDFAGEEQVLYPTGYAELREASPSHPANRHGIDRWIEVTVPFPVAQDDALQIGRAYLAEANQVKAPGSIRVTGHIRDREGNWQPVWKVRAGETVVITNHPNDRPRLIMDTSYDHGSGSTAPSLTMSVDASSKRLEGLLNRILTRRAATNLQ